MTLQQAVKESQLPDCPFCGLHGLRVTGTPKRAIIQCMNPDCSIYRVTIPIKRWTHRPIENRLNERIMELKSRPMIIVEE